MGRHVLSAAFVATAGLAVSLGGQSANPAGQRAATRNYASVGSVSPDGRRVAFASDRDGTHDIYVSEVQGGNVVRLTSTAEIELAPQWAPNDRIMFTVLGRDTARTNTIVSIRPDGSDRRVHASGPAFNSAAFSPDGAKIAYVGRGDAPTRNWLFVMNADGSGTMALSSGAVFAQNPAWSPDGSQIIVAERDSARRQAALVIVRREGGEVRRLTHVPQFAQWPRWSPDGAWVAFMSNDARQHDSHIFVVRPDGNELKQMTSHPKPYLDEMPSWFPDGKRIVISSDRAGRMELLAVNLDGKVLFSMSP